MNNFIIISFILMLTKLKKISCEEDEKNSFKEELYIKPLFSGHIYSHFEFTTKWHSPQIQEAIKNYNSFHFMHFDLFPRALGEIMEQYGVRELHLSLTQGLWRHHKWGHPIVEAPPGAQLWVWFQPQMQDLDQTWKDLVNALSGVFCASLNFIDATNTVFPELSFRPMGLADDWYSKNSSFMRYASLPRENVCTENLTPWKKLLPCDTKSGLSTLLHPTPLYSAHYHSLALHLRPTCKNSDCTQSELELVQSLSLVQNHLHAMAGRQDWTIKQMFSSALISVCPLAHVSKIYVDVTHSNNLTSFTLFPSPPSVISHGQGSTLRILAVYDILQYVLDEPFNLQSRYKEKHIYGVQIPPTLTVQRYITGYGQESGSITVNLKNSGKEDLKVVYLEVLPWYLRLYFHSSHSSQQMDKTRVIKLVTARDRERGWLYEAVLTLKAKSTLEVTLEFTRALLKWLEYPPDANHGFYIPSATFSTYLPDPMNVSVNCLQTTSLWDKLQVREGKSFIRIPSETLLVTLPTPDFSMPYNVICLACTVVALAFGPIHNITTKRLALKKMETKSLTRGKIWDKIKRLLGRITTKQELKDENVNENKDSKDNIVIEENPLYQDKDELEDIEEEDEEEGKRRDVNRGMSEKERKKEERENSKEEKEKINVRLRKKTQQR